MKKKNGEFDVRNLQIVFRFNWLRASNLTLSKTETNGLRWNQRTHGEFRKCIRH